VLSRFKSSITVNKAIAASKESYITSDVIEEAVYKNASNVNKRVVVANKTQEKALELKALV
jgi:hypothetical protein